jgi:hypothetical protein
MGSGRKALGPGRTFFHFWPGPTSSCSLRPKLAAAVRPCRGTTDRPARLSAHFAARRGSPLTGARLDAMKPFLLTPSSAPAAPSTLSRLLLPRHLRTRNNSFRVHATSDPHPPNNRTISLLRRGRFFATSPSSQVGWNRLPALRPVPPTSRLDRFEWFRELFDQMSQRRGRIWLTMMASCLYVMQMAAPTDASGGADPFEVIRAHQVRSLALLIGM